MANTGKAAKTSSVVQVRSVINLSAVFDVLWIVASRCDYGPLIIIIIISININNISVSTHHCVGLPQKVQSLLDATPSLCSGFFLTYDKTHEKIKK